MKRFVGVDDLLVAEVEHDEVPVHRRAALDLLARLVVVLEVELDALLHVGQLEDLLDRVVLHASMSCIISW